MVWFIDIYPAFFIFVGISFFGTMLILLSGGLLGVWMGLECNFFGFIPMLSGKSSEEGEGAMKYFIIQVLGSGMVLLGIAVLIKESGGFNFMSLSELGVLTVLTGLVMKIGVFPFHFWFPGVMGVSSWFNCFMVSTWQKLGMIYFLAGTSLSEGVKFFLLFLGAMTSLVGGVGGVGQVYLRSIMAYSSLVHSGWMLSLCLTSENFFFFYYFIYSLVLFFFFRAMNLGHVVSLIGVSNSFSSNSKTGWFSLMILLFSLSGLPPLIGSSLKMMGILVLLEGSFMFLLILVVSSVVSLFYYLSIFYSSALSFGSLFFLSELSGLKKSNSVRLGVVFNLSFNLVLGVIFFMMVAEFFLL